MRAVAVLLAALPGALAATPLISWGKVSAPETQKLSVGFVFKELDAAEFSFAAGAYEATCASGSVELCQFDLVRRMMAQAPESTVTYEHYRASPDHRTFSPFQVVAGIKEAHLGDVILVDMYGPALEENARMNSLVMQEACELAKQVSRGEYTCFITAKQQPSKITSISARRTLQSTNATRLIDMTPELFMGMFLCLTFTLTLIIFFCCAFFFVCFV